MDKISVIIPVYNVADYLQQCLDSVYKQTYENLEIICVYTKSKDNSYNILKSQKDKRLVTIIRNDGGLGGARNIGIDKATGKYIFFLDSDDWIEKNTIELLHKKITEDKSDFVMFPFYSYDSTKNAIIDGTWGSTLNINNVNSPFSYNDLNVDNIISGNSIVVAWNKLYKASFLNDNNIRFLENLRYEDNPFYYSCLLKANKISYIDQKLLYYRVNRKQSLQSTSYDNKNVLDIVPIMKEVYSIFRHLSSDKTIQDSAEKYILNEFAWRYELMNCNTYMFKRNIEKNFGESFYFKFLNKIGITGNYINIIKKNKRINNPKISIIIPVYNVEKYIDDCIISILNQTLKEIEIIIIDDNSLDDSIKIAEEYMNKDNRICIYKTPTNSGAGPARNIGLDKATGKYIFFIDPDDMLADDNTLQKMYEIAEKNACSTVCANIKVVGKDSHYKNYGELQDYNGYNVRKNKIIHYSDYNIWSSWGFTRFLYLKKIIDDYQLRFPAARNYEDPVFFVSYMIKCDSIYQINEDVYYYRYFDKGRNLKYESIVNIINSMCYLFKAYDDNKFYIQYGNEYNNLIKFINNDFNDLLNQKSLEAKKARVLINDLLKTLNYDILKDYYNGEIVKQISMNKKIKKDKNIIKVLNNKSKKFVKLIVRPIYSRLMNRIDDMIENKIKDMYLQRNVLDDLYKKSLYFNVSIDNIIEKENDINSKINNLSKIKKVVENNNVDVKKISNEITLIRNEIDSNYREYKNTYERLKRENNILKKYIANYSNYYNNRTIVSDKIKVGILFQIPSFWPSIESIYEKMKEDYNNFEVKFFLIENNKELSQAKGAKKFLENNNIDYVIGNIENINSYHPDILLIQSPYDLWHRTEELYSENLLNMGYRLLYIPYGFELSDERRSVELQFRLDFYNNCWKIYTCSEDVKNQYLEYNSLLSNNLVALGSPRLDSIYHKRYTPIREKIIHDGKKNILLKIHFSLKMDFEGLKIVTPDLQLYLDFLQKKYRSDEYNLYLMLHPKFYDEMSPNLIDKFKHSIKKSNAILIEDDDYREILYNIDAVISDRSGMLIEFAALNIPILYLVNDQSEELIIKPFQYLFNSFDKTSNIAGITNFIDAVLNDKDDNKSQREEAFNYTFPMYDGEATSRIIEDIKKTIKDESKNK